MAAEKLTALACIALVLAQPPIVARGSAASAAGVPKGIESVPLCLGDCDGDGVIITDELVAAVSLALLQPAESCPAFDSLGGAVTVEQIVGAVGRDLANCSDEPVSLSAAALTPGEMLTIFHPSITAGSRVTVAFRGADRYAIAVATDLTEDGAARIAVPPYIDTETAQFTAGEVAVSIPGVDPQPLLIRELPEVDAAPGELTVTLLDIAAENMFDALDGVEALVAETGVEQPQLVSALLDNIDVVETMADEIDFSGHLTLETPTGPAVLGPQHLALLDRLIAAPFLGGIAELGAGASLRSARGPGLPTSDELATLVDRARRQAIAGVQVVGSYVSVLTGAVGLVAVFVPGGEPLAGVAAAASVASTGVVTLGSALLSVAADAGIDAIRGEDFDTDRARRNAQDVVIGGLRSIALTALGAIEWAGAIPAGLASLANDTRDGVNNVRDLHCATKQRRRIGFPRALGDLCQMTAGTATPTVHLASTATPTVHTAATATRTTARTPTQAPSLAPTHSRTPTRVAATSTPALTATPTKPMATATNTGTPTARTATATPTRTSTRTPTGGTFTVVAWANLDGSTGTDPGAAQLQISGARDFPTLSWKASLTDVIALSVGVAGAGFTYAIAAESDDQENLIPIQGPVRYGDYSVPHTVALLDFPAPPLQPGTDYVVGATSLHGPAALVFHVNP